MLYNVVLVSVVQQSESAIRIHISPYPLPLEPPSHSPYPTPLGGHKASSRSPCAMQQLPTSHPFYIWYICQCYSLTSSQLPLPPLCPQVCSLCLRLYSCPATRFISTVFFYIPYMQYVYFFSPFFTHNWYLEKSLKRSPIPTYPLIRIFTS